MLNKDMQRAHKISNITQTAIMLVGIGALLVLSTGLLWGWYGIQLAVAIVIILFVFSTRVPASIIMLMYKGQLASKVGAKELAYITAKLAERAGLEKVPAVYIIPSLSLNAFAAGCKADAAIGITVGLMRKLSTRQMAGVLAHEVSHIKNNDLLVMSFADLMSRLTQMLSYVAVILVFLNVTALLMNGEAAYSWLGILILYLAPVMTNLMQLSLSRTREYDADLEAVRLTGDAQSLIRALTKVERYTGHFWEDIMLPVPARKVPQPSLLRSHPKTEDRIARLQQLEEQRVPTMIVRDEPLMITMVGLGPISMRPRYRFPGIWY